MVTTKQAKSDENIIKEIKEFEGNYIPLDKDRLVLFAVDFLESRNIEPTLDKIVVTAFKLFPKKFSLVGFPEYPDALIIDNCARLHCTRTKGWLFGNAKSGFKVTEKGKYFLEETKKMLKGKIKLTKVYGVIPRRKEVTFINLLKKTDAYKKYEQSRRDDITESEILEALRVEPTSKNLVQKHLKKYSDYATRINDEAVKEFLEVIKSKIKSDKNA